MFFIIKLIKNAGTVTLFDLHMAVSRRSSEESGTQTSACFDFDKQ